MKRLIKSAVCMVTAAVMFAVLLPSGGFSSGRNSNYIWIHNLDLPNTLIVESGPFAIEDMYGVLLSVGTPRPADGVLPDEISAVKMNETQTPFYDRNQTHPESFRYYSGEFNLTGLNGSYVLYVTDSGGESWAPFYDSAACNILIQDNKIKVITHGAWGTGQDISGADWNEYINRVESSLKDGVINVTAYSGWLIYNTPMTMRLVEEVTNTLIATKDVDYGDPATNWMYGMSFSADFELPKAEGFYKVYFDFNINGSWSFEASEAYWVQKDGDDKFKVSVIELSGINSPMLDYDDYQVLPQGFHNPEDRSYIYPPRLDLYSGSERSLIFPGSDEIIGYSLDGGSTWVAPTKGSIEILAARDMVKRLKSSGSCQLALRLKRPELHGELPEDEAIVVFPVVKAAPDAPKLTANYQALYLSGSTQIPSLETLSQQTFWALTAANSDAIVLEDIQISPLSYSSQHPWAWHKMPETGVAVKPLQITPSVARNGKIAYRAKRQTAHYAIRVGAKENKEDGSYTLPSSIVRIKAAGLEAPKTVRPDYKNERVRPPKGTEYNIGGDRKTGDGRFNADISDAESWSYRALPTRKKAAGVAVSHRIAPRGTFDKGTTALENGKMKFDRQLEFYNPANGKWGGFKAPRGPQGTTEILVRTKASGRLKTTLGYQQLQAQSATLHDSPAAAGTPELAGETRWIPESQVLLASEEYRFVYEWGDVTDSKGKAKTGITRYSFEPVENS